MFYSLFVLFVCFKFKIKFTNWNLPVVGSYTIVPSLAHFLEGREGGGRWLSPFRYFKEMKIFSFRLSKNIL